jgi:uncharacterized protein
MLQIQRPSFTVLKMHFQHPIVTRSLLERVVGDDLSRLQGIHGLPHWLRVEENGLYLAAQEEADTDVVALFALLHDARRLNDYTDPEHGKRAAYLAQELYEESFLPISKDQLKVLAYACAHHTDETYTDDTTIACCWDADRLDLCRIGMQIDPEKLNTGSAKRTTASRQ